MSVLSSSQRQERILMAYHTFFSVLAFALKVSAVVVGLIIVAPILTTLIHGS